MNAATRRLRRIGAALVAGLFTVGGLVTLTAPQDAQAAPGDTGQVTSVPRVSGSGKAQGSGKWGLVGEVQTRTAASGTVFNYDLELNPADGSMWVSDSGKVGWGRFECAVAGNPPCQLGTPRVFRYGQLTTDWTLGQYATDGTFAAAAAGANSGIGLNWQGASDRTVIAMPFASASTPNITNGPRGIAFASGGTAFVVNSDDASRPGGAPGAVRLLNAAGTQIGATGFGGVAANWGQRDEPGTMFFPVGAATMADGNIVVTSQGSDRLAVYGADGTFVRFMLLDRPQGTAYAGDDGYRPPYAVTVDPTNGDLIVGYSRSDVQGAAGIIERINPATGALLQTYLSSDLQKTNTVVTVGVHPGTGHVFGWTQTGSVVEWAADGRQVRVWKSGDDPNTFKFPNLSSGRGLTFDEGGRMYFTVQQGFTSAKVEILGQTPVPVASATAMRSTDGTSAVVNWAIDQSAQANLEHGLGGLPIKDFVIEQSTDNGATWSVVKKAAASTSTSRTLTGLDPNRTYAFRVSAWNEAGNGDWREAAPVLPPVANPDEVTAEIGSGEVSIEVLANDTNGTGTAITAADAEVTLIDASKSSDDPARFTDTLTFPGVGTYHVSADGQVVLTPDASITTTTTLPKVPYAIGPAGARSESTLQVTLLAVGIAIEKSGSVTAPSHVGDPVTWTITVTNTGDVALSNVAVDDPGLGGASVTWVWPDAAQPGEIPVKMSATGTATTLVTQADLDAGSVANAAAVTAKTPAGQTLSGSADATVDLIAAPLPPVANPDEVTAEIGSGEVTIDVLANDTTADGTAITAAQAGVMLIDESKTVDDPARFTDTLTFPGVGTYHVSANGRVVLAPDASITTTTTLPKVPYAIGPDGARSESTLQVTLVEIGVSIAKTGTVASPAKVGDPVTWTITVTNAGSVPLSGVTVADAGLGGAAISWAWPDAGHVGTLPVGASASGTATTALNQADIDAGTVTNTAMVEGTTPAGQTVRASAEARVEIVVAPPTPDPTTPPTTVEPTPGPTTFEPTPGPTETGTPTAVPTTVPATATPTNTGAALASTGAEGLLPAGGAAAMLLAAGIVLLLRRRRA